MTSERELTAPVLLTGNDGRLNRDAVGWSRQPLHTGNLIGHWPRKKRWNYWCVTSDQALFSATISNLDYAAMIFIYVLEFATRRFAEQTVTIPLGRGCRMGDTVAAPASAVSKPLTVSFASEGPVTVLTVTSRDCGGVPLNAEIRVTTPPGHQTMNVVIPWSDDKYQFTSKQQCLPAAGEVRWGDTVLAFPDGASYACLDFGRGIWPYSSTWNWAAFSARQNDRTIGVNLGGRWTDGTGYTENALVVDGIVSKLAESLDFTYDPADYTKEWTIRSRGNDRVDLRFAPFYDRTAATNLLIVKSSLHQLIGRFTGTVVSDAGERLTVSDAVGFAEEHFARW